MSGSPNRLKIFEAHGVEFTAAHEKEAIGTCPFTGKQEKFYVNTESWLWDSKTAGMSGNIPQFLDKISLEYEKHITPAHWRALSADRHLPEAAFKGWRIGWNGSAYTIPVRDAGGHVTDIRLYKIGKRTMATPGGALGLLGAERLNADMAAPVYVCEGEWDTIALRWLLKKLDEPGIVVGLPGAGIFKSDWVPWFSGRVVHTLFDNDEAGENGELHIAKKLTSIAQRVTYTHWPAGLKTGFDTRDWIVYGAVERNTPDECWDALVALFRPTARKRPIADPTPGQPPSTGSERNLSGGKAPASGPVKTRWPKPPSLDNVCSTFKKWLFLDNTDAIRVMLACAVSQDIPGPPIWLFLVSPPGGAKTETVSSLSQWERTYLTSSLTPHALISGANWKGDVDPSLIPRLNGKVMVIKDFTAILSMREMERDEIFGILRDAYDGSCRKVFGTGLERMYTSRFTIIAAVTPRIHDLSATHASLGERFLKFTMGDNLKHTSEEDIIGRAIDNIAQTTQMQEELQDVVTAFLTRRIKIQVDKLPDIPPSIKTRIIHLGMFGARMRGTVSRDKYRNDIVTSRPSAEVGSRLGIQLAKLAKSLAVIHQRQAVTEDDFRLVKKVMLDTLPQRTEDIIRHLVLTCQGDRHITIEDLARASRYPTATVQRIMQDMHVLDIVERKGTSSRYQWRPSAYIREAVEKSGLYRTEEERTRPTRLWIKMVKKKKPTPKLVLASSRAQEA
jgi:hypothetical protein